MFSKRFNLFQFKGIPIGIDVSWFFIAILLSWTLAIGHFPSLYPGLPHEHYWFMGILGMLGLFVCIILHELGHALVAKHFQLPVVQITLFVFGGIAELKKEAERPWVEFLVAVGGPIVSIALSILFYALSLIGVHSEWPIQITGVTEYLAMINTLIVLFNLIPAFPLDGGRILRSILWGWKKNLAWATKITSQMGSGFGIFLLFLGLFYIISGHLITGIWFGVIGLFLQKAASASLTQFLVSKQLKAEIVGTLMKTNLDTVSPYMSVQELVEQHICRSHHQLYPVTEEKKLIGYVSLQEIRLIAPEDRSSVFLQKVMIPIGQFVVVSPKTHALEALDIIQQLPIPTLLVVEHQELVGILTAQDLFKLISLKLELEKMGK